MSENMSIDKKEPTKDGSEESVPSSPENEAADRSSAPQESQPAKRKGGRKPVSHQKKRKTQKKKRKRKS